MRIFFHNGSNYDLKRKLKKKQFNCSGESTKKILQFQQKNTLRELAKMKNKFIKKVSYVLQFIDSAIFLASSNFIDNSSEGIHRIK